MCECSSRLRNHPNGCFAFPEIKPADTVAVIGAGPTGLCGLMCAKLYGPGQVIAIDVSEERLELVRREGLADVVLNPLFQNVEQEILRLTDNRGADAVLDAYDVFEKKKDGVIKYAIRMGAM